jgi:hypothetical protein
MAWATVGKTGVAFVIAGGMGFALMFDTVFSSGGSLRKVAEKRQDGRCIMQEITQRPC